MFSYRLFAVFFFLFIKAEIVVLCEIVSRGLRGREVKTEKRSGAGKDNAWLGVDQDCIGQ